MEATVKKIHFWEILLLGIPTLITIGGVWISLNQRIDKLENTVEFHQQIINNQEQKLDKILDKVSQIQIDLQNKEPRK